MTGGKEPPSGEERLEEQVQNLLSDANGTVGLVCRLDFGFVKDSDQYADWHASTPMTPVFRALLFKELQGLSYSELHRYLEKNEDTTEAFGFDKLPARTTFGRAWRDRLDDELRSLIRDSGERIRQLGRQNGLLIGSRAIKPKDNKNASKRTKNRYISEKAEEVTSAMQRLVFPVFEFGRDASTKYESDAFLELQSHLGLSQSAAESGTKLFAQDTRRDRGSPDADTHLHNIQRLTRDQVAKMLNEAIGRMASEAKRHLEFSRPADVAIDMTYVAYYGQRDELEMVYGAPPSKSYDWCFKFATLTVVGDNVTSSSRWRSSPSRRVKSWLVRRFETSSNE